jgi:nucleoid-associated protein YgaU
MSELERYGVAAFAVTLILVLLISLGGLTRKGDAQLARIPLPVAEASAPRSMNDGPLVAARGDSALSEPTSSLDFADDVHIETEAPGATPANGRGSPPIVNATALDTGGKGEPASVKTPPPSSYRVQRGDTLARIAAKIFGDSKRASDIAALNGLSGSSRLMAGQELRLSGKAPAATATQTPAKKLERSPAAVRIYTVEKGDTLESIAEKQLGDKRRWREIYDFNRKRLKKPDCVVAGVKLQLPEK